MKPIVRMLFLLIAAILTILALCIPVAFGSYESEPPGKTVECVFYWGGYYTYIETGEYMRVGIEGALAGLGGVSMFLLITGAAYVLITLLPRLRAGKTAFLGGVLILVGTIFYIPIIGIFEVEMEVQPWDDILIGSFAHLNPVSLILGLAAAGLAMAGGILTWLDNRKLPR